MSNVISLTVPRDDEAALVAGATMLLTLAGKTPAMELPEVRDPYAGCCGGVEPPETPCIVMQRPPYQVDYEDSPCKHWPQGCQSCERPDRLEKFATMQGDDVSKFMDKVLEIAGAKTGDLWPIPGQTQAFDGNEDTDSTPVDEEPTGPELDADGLPWDARIHSGSKAILQDGTWRKKRGVDQADYDRIVEELKQLMAVPVVETEVYSEEQTEEIKEALESEPSFIPPPPAPAPAAEQQDAVTPPPPPKMSSDGYLIDVPQTFPQFLKAITARINAKELTMDQVNAALPEGVVNLQALGANRPDLIPSVWAKLP